MKFLTTFIISGPPRPERIPKEFEADSPEQAADLAGNYWLRNWKGHEITTETCIDVQAYVPDSGDLDEHVAFHLILRWPGYDDALKKDLRL